MFKAIKIAIVAAVLALGSTTAFAVGEPQDLGGYLGKTSEEITVTLKQKGYEVRKIDTEDGYLEAYALKDGQRYEIYVDPKNGTLVKVKRD